MVTSVEATAQLARVEEYQGLTMAIAPAEAMRRVQELQAFVQSVMKVNVDFGVIPGTGDKPTLLQPGAQKLAEVYGFAHRFEAIETIRDWDKGFFYFEVRCSLTSRRDGSFVGEGIGSCNSKESKYAGRWVPAEEVPKGIDRSTLQKRVRVEWLFESKLPKGTDLARLKREERTSKKNGSKYWVYAFEQETFFTPNPDPWSLVNTLQKMACKRAYIHAVIAATRSGGTFTQDVEDLPPEVFGKASAERTWEERSETTAAPEPIPTAPVEPTKEERAATARMAMRWAELETAKTLEDLGKTWEATRADVRKKLLSKAQLEQLARVKDATKAALDHQARADAAADAGRAGDDMGPMPEEWGGDGKPTPPAASGPPCVVCGKATRDDAISTKGGVRHPDCSPFGVSGERQPGED